MPAVKLSTLHLPLALVLFAVCGLNVYVIFFGTMPTGLTWANGLAVAFCFVLGVSSLDTWWTGRRR
jgi:hypothetical protein